MGERRREKGREESNVEMEGWEKEGGRKVM